MPKKIKLLLAIGIPVVIVAILAIGIVPSLLKNMKGQSGEEWFQKQKEYLDLFSVYSESVDYVYGAYITGVSSESAFLEDLDVLEQEVLMLKQDYDRYLAENPVREGTMDANMAEGCAGVYACFGSFLHMFADTRTVSADPEQVHYVYIAYADEITANTTKYRVSEWFLTDAPQLPAGDAATPETTAPTVAFR